jgi:hypothetical protein
MVVAAVLGLGLAAGVDALRGPGEPSGGRVETDAGGLEPVAEDLRGAGLSGVITYSDERCRLHAVRLPDLRSQRAPAIESCEPHVPSGGLGAWKGDVVWAGLGYRTVQVVLSKAELSRALRRSGRDVAGGYAARQAVALAEERYAVLAYAPKAPWERLVVLFEGERFHAIAAIVGSDTVLRPSPSGRYVAVVGSQGSGVRMFGQDGRQITLPPVGTARALAWSPDERWTALATRWSVHVFLTEGPEGPVLRIPLAVRDLDWDA